MEEQKIISELEGNPYAFYYIYILYTKNSDMLLGFIDRRKTIDSINHLELVEYNLNEKVHAHYNPSSLTPSGRKFCENNIDLLQYYFEDCPK